MARWLCRNQLRFMGCRLDVLGVENVPDDRACLLLGNHESRFDVFAVGGSLQRFAVGLEAASHFKMPIWGRITRAWGQLPLPEGRMAEARETFDQAAAVLTSGTDVIILPEGHRTRTGALGDLKKGAFHLALATKADILPFVQQGLYEFHNTHSWRLFPRRLRVIFGKPIPFESFKDSSVEDLRDRVRETLLELDKGWEARKPER
ncbi:MAG: hypothetical protein DRJ65_11680 [Acidobacteria bacterium]|nr:MAG: hypothetical protein DRJ65_11680 [Acidobacteriota bacterium]